MKNNEIHYIKTPQFGVNDDNADLIEWHKDDFIEISSGDIVATMETTKAAFEIEAESSGILIHLVEVGENIAVNDPIAVITNNIEEGKSFKEEYIRNTKADKTLSNDSALKASKKALALAKKNNIDLNDLRSEGNIIRESDVLAFINKDNLDFKVQLQKQKDIKKESVIIYGAGLGGNTVKETIDLGHDYEAVCFVDDNISTNSNASTLPVNSSDRLKDLYDLGHKNVAIAVTPGKLRVKIFNKINDIGFNFINVIHPKSFISPTASLGIGNHIKSGAIVETNTAIGNFCIIDNAVTIAHDNSIADGCHIAPGVSLGSSINVQENTVIGIGSSVSTGIKIGKNAIISVGSSITSDVKDNTIVEGVPAKVIGKTK